MSTYCHYMYKLRWPRVLSITYKFQGHRHFGSGEDFEGILLYWQASEFHHGHETQSLEQTFVPSTQVGPHKIWLQSAQWFQWRCLRMLTDDGRRTTDAWLDYKLTFEPKDSG